MGRIYSTHGEMRNVYNIFIGKPGVKRPLWRCRDKNYAANMEGIFLRGKALSKIHTDGTFPLCIFMNLVFKTY